MIDQITLTTLYDIIPHYIKGMDSVVDQGSEDGIPAITGLTRKKLGRPPGSLNVPKSYLPSVRDHNAVFNRVEGMIAALIRDGAKLPLVFLWEQMSSTKNSMDTRLECAKAIMPYVHRKRVTDIEKMAAGGVNIYQQVNIAAKKLEGLTDDELRNLATLASKLALTGDDSGGVEQAQEVEVTEVLPG
jgi:hypothetical protein